MKRPCGPPTDLPERALTAADMARALAADRNSLGDCRRRHAALAAAATELERQGN